MTLTPRIMQAMAIKSALEFYLKTGMKMNSAYTLSAMLRTAGTITGSAYGPTEGKLAVAALQTWIEENRK